MSSPMRRKGRWVEDARGRSVTLLDPLWMSLLGRYDAIGPTALRAVAEEIEPKLARYGRLKIIGGVLFVITLFLFNMHGEWVFFGDPVSWRVRPVLIASAGALLPFIIGYSVYRRLRQASFERVLPVLLKHRRCAHCGYDIRGLPVEPETLVTTCPECGCAWRIDDAEIAARLAASAPRGSFFGSMSPRMLVTLLIILATMSLLGLALVLFRR